MALGFVPGARRGQHYELASATIKKLKAVNLHVKGYSERHFEHQIVSHLQSSPTLRPNLITQIDLDEVDKISRANLFGFSHKPDVSIGNDGTAIEIKVISRGNDIKSILGQAIAYRMHYRFVILILIDQTEDRRIVDLCRGKENQEFNLLSDLADSMNIFSIVSPEGQAKNIVFGM